MSFKSSGFGKFGTFTHVDMQTISSLLILMHSIISLVDMTSFDKSEIPIVTWRHDITYITLFQLAMLFWRWPQYLTAVCMICVPVVKT